jgi:hypothetical protein
MDAPVEMLPCRGDCGVLLPHLSFVRPHQPFLGPLWSCRVCSKRRPLQLPERAPAAGDVWKACIYRCHRQTAHQVLPLPPRPPVHHMVAHVCRGCGQAHLDMPRHYLVGLRRTACGRASGECRCAADPVLVTCPGCLSALVAQPRDFEARNGPVRQAWYECSQPEAHDGFLLATAGGQELLCRDCSPLEVQHYLEIPADCPSCSSAWACPKHFRGLCRTPLKGAAHTRLPEEVGCRRCQVALVERYGQAAIPDWRPAEALAEDHYA